MNGNLSSNGDPNVGGHQLQVSATSFMTVIEIRPSVGYTDAELLARYGQFIQITVNSGVTANLSALVSPDLGTQRSAGALIGASAQLLTQQGSDLVNASGNFGYNTNLGASGTSNFGQSLMPSVFADWNSTISVRFNLSGSAGVSSLVNASGFADFSAGNSLSFSKTGPEFILPKGFTVNVPEIGIINNIWFDPRVAPVPLPAGFPLLLAALSVMSLIRRRCS